MTLSRSLTTAGLMLGALLLVSDAAVAQQRRSSQDANTRSRAGQQAERPAARTGEQDTNARQRTRPATRTGEQEAGARERTRPGRTGDEAAGDGQDQAARRTARREVLKQTAQEVSKHRGRVARIKRMLEIAKQKGDTQKVAALESMLTKENRRHERFMATVESKIGKSGVNRLKEKIKERKAKTARTHKPGERRAGAEDAAGGERTRRAPGAANDPADDSGGNRRTGGESDRERNPGNSSGNRDGGRDNGNRGGGNRGGGA